MLVETSPDERHGRQIQGAPRGRKQAFLCSHGGIESLDFRRQFQCRDDQEVAKERRPGQVRQIARCAAALEQGAPLRARIRGGERLVEGPIENLIEGHFGRGAPCEGIDAVGAPPCEFTLESKPLPGAGGAEPFPLAR